MQGNPQPRGTGTPAAAQHGADAVLAPAQGQRLAARAGEAHAGPFEQRGHVGLELRPAERRLAEVEDDVGRVALEPREDLARLAADLGDRRVRQHLGDALRGRLQIELPYVPPGLDRSGGSGVQDEHVHRETSALSRSARPCAPPRRAGCPARARRRAAGRGQEDEIAVVGIEAGQGIALDEVRAAGGVEPEVETGEVPAAEQPIRGEREPPQRGLGLGRDARRHVIADTPAPVALDVHRVDERRAPVRRRDLHQPEHARAGAVAGDADGDLGPGQVLLHEDRTAVACAQPAGAGQCGRAVVAPPRRRRCPCSSPRRWASPAPGSAARRAPPRRPRRRAAPPAPPAPRATPRAGRGPCRA